MTTNAGFLLDSMFDFAERFNKMCLIDEEIALFSAVVLMSPGIYLIAKPHFVVTYVGILCLNNT